MEKKDFNLNVRPQFDSAKIGAVKIYGDFKGHGKQTLSIRFTPDSGN
ncbi:MAG: hypothetical protein N2487_05240 [Verrucomicrobiae bacterium]|nr:hypothetical protein [Verrucomicrobiae bacterium]